VSITAGANPSRVIVLAAMSFVALGIAAAPTAGADDRSCTNTSANTTICSRPGGSTSINTSPRSSSRSPDIRFAPAGSAATVTQKP